MKVPLLDLQAQYDSIKPEIKQAVDQVLESQSFIMGDFVKRFEEEVAEYCNTEHAFGCASGSDALLLALMAIDIEPGDYVITSPFTFFATAGAVSRLGAIPIFIDIEPNSFNIDPDKVRAFLEGKDKLSRRLGIDQSKIKAIIPVHLYGQAAEMEPILKLAEEFDLKIIEDAAQSIGTKYKGSLVGNLGDFGCFSFFPSKNLGAYGDAGLITVKNPEQAKKIDILRLHGARPKYHHKYVGINSRLDAIQAAILSVKIKHLDAWSEKRQTIAKTYNKLFEQAGLVENQSVSCFGDCSCMGQEGCDLDSSRIILPKETTGLSDSGGRHIYHQYTIRLKHREQIQKTLKDEGIGSSVYYPLPLHVQECFKELGYSPNDCPVAMCASNQALSLPIYPELREDQVEKVVNTISKALN
ncbi:MAG: DegT/DnrJ/EryC1/StrS family aminotransferase [Balneolaceae bacterium]